MGSSRKNLSLNQITQKEDLFVREYLIDLSPSNAAVRAGFPPYAGARLLRRLAVKDAVDRAIAARSARVGITAERVLDELGNIAFANPAELFDELGRLRPLGEMGPDQAKMITGMKTRRAVTLADDGKTMVPEEITEYKFVDKLAAVSLVMRHLGMFKDTLSIEVTSLAERLQMAQRRVGVKQPPGSDTEDITTDIDGEFEEIIDDDNVDDFI